MLLQAAAGIGGPEERRAFLQATCAGDPALLADLLETLTVEERRLSAQSAAPKTLAPGQMVFDRFQILRQLGEGGMAVVYEAIDRKLMERRALKFPKTGHLHAIPEEARNALRVTHENICRTHEIHTATVDGAPADFISMELLEGETLLSRWRREPVPRAEAVEIARQLCRGLEAAHAARVLHQDLKSNNVMLVRRADGSLRVVITDFGLALSFGPRGASVALGGTPNYIAPERWKGAPATPAADVYALGVILYEMLAGRLPFSRETPWERRLSGLPEPPSRSGRAPDRRWDAIVLRCLEPEPARRFSSAGAVRLSIERAFGGYTRRRWLVAAAIAVAALSPVALLRNRIWPPPLVRLAVLPFAGSTADRNVDDAVRGALHDLGRRLESLGASSQRLVVIPLEDALRYEVSTPAAAAARLGATHVLAGTLVAQGKGFAVRASVTDARSGAALREFTGEFRGQDLAVLPASLAGVVTSAFHLDRAPPAAIRPEAYPRYASGLQFLRAAPADPDRAIAAFREAIELDGSSALIYGRLADAYYGKYSATKDARWLTEAAASARRAESLQPDAPPVLLVLGSIEQAEGRPERAIELFRRAAALEPGNSDAWRRAGIAFQQIGRDADAVGALRQAVRLAPDYYRPHLSLGFIYFRMGRYADAAGEFRVVTQLAPEHPDGYSNLGGALLAMEKEPAAERALRKALALRETRATLNNLAVLLRYQHRDGEAVGVLERALRVGADDAGLRLNLGNALRRTGRPDAAREHFRHARDLAQAALRRDPRDAVARARLAYSMVRLGAAALAADEALQAARLAPTDYSVLFWSVAALDALNRRQDALSLLTGAPYERLRDLRRQPDLADFARDPRFLALLHQSQTLPAQERTRNDARND